MAKRRGHGEGGIYQRDSDGKWCASVDLGYSDGKRKRRIIYGKTRKEVADKLKELHRDQASGVQLATQQQTLQQFLDAWLDQTVKRRNRPSTYRKYKKDIQHHITPTLGRCQLAKLTPDQVQKLLNTLADNDLSQRTIRNVRAVLRTALNQAMRYGYVVRNVATLVDIPGSVSFTAQPLDEEQAQRFLAAIKGHRLEALFRLALGIGLRKGEVLALRWQDVDLEVATVRISGSLQRQNGVLERTSTKTAASVRTIALSPSQIKMLRKHRELQQKEREFAKDWHESEYVFTSTIGTPLSPEGLNDYFKAALKKAELPETIRFHDLRHSCATLMIKRRVHPRAIMDVLGHTQISTTMNTYAHVLAEVQREAVESLDSLFSDDE